MKGYASTRVTPILASMRGLLMRVTPRRPWPGSSAVSVCLAHVLHDARKALELVHGVVNVAAETQV